MSTISVIDYGMGNLCSVVNAFKFWHTKVELVHTPEGIRNAEKLVLPGVGSFYAAMKSLARLNLLSPLHAAVLEEKKPVLGICLGMQIMATLGSEGGEIKGLGWIEGKVELNIPHVGFNYVKKLAVSQDLVLGHDTSARDYYFCHSYRLLSNDRNFAIWKSHYEQDFIAAIQKENIWGTQFHPEKSQSNGLLLIKRFIDWSAK